MILGKKEKGEFIDLMDKSLIESKSEKLLSSTVPLIKRVIAY